LPGAILIAALGGVLGIAFGGVLGSATDLAFGGVLGAAMPGPSSQLHASRLPLHHLSPLLQVLLLFSSW